jgi:hypothetical protein
MIFFDMDLYGLKPGNCLVFNCPDLKVGAIHVLDIHGFSHLDEIYRTFLDRTLYWFWIETQNPTEPC